MGAFDPHYAMRRQRALDRCWHEKPNLVNRLHGFGLFRRDSMVGNTAIYLFANILNGAIPFLLLPVLTRYLNPAEYGVIGMFHMLVAIFAAVTGLSVPGAANRKYFDRNEGLDLPAFIGSCVQVISFSTFIVLLIAFAVREQLTEITGVPPNWILVAVLVSGINFIAQLRLGQWLIRKQSFQYGAFQVGLSLLNMGLSLWLVVVMRQGLEGRLWGQSASLIVCGLVALALLNKDRLLKFTWRGDYVLDALKFGIPLVPHIAGMFLLSMVDRFIINNALGLTQVGIYIVAVQLAMGLGIVTDAINKAYVPWLYERLKANETSTKRKIVAGTYIYFVVALIAAGIVALIAPWFVPWFAGEPYRAAGSVLGWLALGQAFRGMYLMVTNYVFFSQKTFKLSLATVASGAIHVALVYFMVRWMGIEGAAMAFAISMGVRFLITWLIAQQQHAMPWLRPMFQI